MAGVIPFRDLASGPDPTAHPGQSGSLGLLAPTSEPASAGEPPVAPDVVSEVGRRRSTRAIRGVDGRLTTAPTAGRGRAVYLIAWTGVSAADAALIRNWFDAMLNRGESAFDARVDGQQAAAVAVLPIERLDERFVSLDAYTLAVRAEEVFS